RYRGGIDGVRTRRSRCPTACTSCCLRKATVRSEWRGTRCACSWPHATARMRKPVARTTTARRSSRWPRA
ncbi:hypothetical protein Dimus_030311, partial [Dionaea muscipula]